MAENLLAAIVDASKAYADPIAAAYASGNRNVTVRIERPGGDRVYDRASGTWSPETTTVVYSGGARIWPVTGSAQVTVGEDFQEISNVRVSIDDTVNVPPRIEDRIIVVADAASAAVHLSEREFTVDDVEVGGHFGIGWHLRASGVGPSRSNP